MANEVWIVSYDRYDGEGLLCAFSTEEKAREFVEQYNAVSGYVEYFELDIDSQFVNHAGLSLYAVYVDTSTGQINDVRKDASPPPHSMFYVQPNLYHDRNLFRITGWFRDEAHAAEVTADKYAEFVAKVEAGLEKWER